MSDVIEAEKIMTVNYTGACVLLSFCANALIKQKKGFIAALSSVAGDRGRQSNYVYGAAKGMVSLFLQGLRNRLAKQGVQVSGVPETVTASLKLTWMLITLPTP